MSPGSLVRTRSPGTASRTTVASIASAVPAGQPSRRGRAPRRWGRSRRGCLRGRTRSRTGSLARRPSPPDTWLATDQLDRAVAAYLTRFTGSSREHARSELRCVPAWCAGRQLHPLPARRPHLELYIGWMQEIRRFKPSTVSRRFSVAAGFYRTAVTDGVLDHSPAEHVRRQPCRPSRPPWGSRTCSSRPCSPPAANDPALSR
jgi:hypothetical protein